MARCGQTRLVRLTAWLSFGLTDVSVILLAAVAVVNGFTDAPNAIVNCVTTGCLSVRKASLLAAVFNMAGTAAGYLFFGKVAYTVSGLVSFGSGTQADTAVAAALAAVVIWALSAWKFGIPTSESHALAAGLAGSGLAFMGEGASAVAFGASEWLRLLSGLMASVAAGFLLGVLSGICVKQAKLSEHVMRRCQISAAATASFMHGAQDGQKFIGIYIMLNGSSNATLAAIVCGLLIAAGTRVGGKRIINTVGRKMLSMESYQGVASDIACSVTLLGCTLFGLPVSTTHSKTAAIMGVGRSATDKKTAVGIIIAWLLTFPCAAAVAYIITKLLLKVL